MKKRLDAAKRLMHLQDQKVRLVETQLARLRADLQHLEEEEARLHGQIEGTVSGHSDIFDLLFRRLDQLTRRRFAKQGEIAGAVAALAQEKLRGEAAVRLKHEAQLHVQTDEDRRALLEIIERVGRQAATSFR